MNYFIIMELHATYRMSEFSSQIRVYMNRSVFHDVFMLHNVIQNLFPERFWQLLNAICFAELIYDICGVQIACIFRIIVESFPSVTAFINAVTGTRLYSVCFHLFYIHFKLKKKGRVMLGTGCAPTLNITAHFLTLSAPKDHVSVALSLSNLSTYTFPAQTASIALPRLNTVTTVSIPSSMFDTVNP